MPGDNKSVPFENGLSQNIRAAAHVQSLLCPLPHVRYLIQVIVQLVLELVVRHGRLELVALALLLVDVDLRRGLIEAVARALAVRLGAPEAVLRVLDVHHRLLPLLALVVIPRMKHRLLRGAFGVLVEGED